MNQAHPIKYHREPVTSADQRPTAPYSCLFPSLETARGIRQQRQSRPGASGHCGSREVPRSGEKCSTLTGGVDRGQRFIGQREMYVFLRHVTTPLRADLSVFSQIGLTQRLDDDDDDEFAFKAGRLLVLKNPTLQPSKRTPIRPARYGDTPADSDSRRWNEQ